ncbi:MAG: hypothetical protein QXF49_00320 [Thermosphaera sp.]
MVYIVFSFISWILYRVLSGFGFSFSVLLAPNDFLKGLGENVVSQ